MKPNAPRPTHLVSLAVLLGAALCGPPVSADEPKAPAGPAEPSAAESARQDPPVERKWPCRELSTLQVHRLEDNAGQMALTLRSATRSCGPNFSDDDVDVKAPSGRWLRFSSRTVQKAPGQLDETQSRYELAFEDGSVLALKVGQAFLVPPGLTPEHPGSRFTYKGRELVFTIDRPVKPVWTSKEGVAFRELLPADAGEIIEALADGGKALEEEGVLIPGFFGLFVSLYRGAENGAYGRDGWTLTLVDRAARPGAEARAATPPAADRTP